MKYIKRRSGFALCLLCAVLMLTACVGKGNTSANTENTQNTVNTQPAENTAPQQPAANTAENTANTAVTEDALYQRLVLVLDEFRSLGTGSIKTAKSYNTGTTMAASGSLYNSSGTDYSTTDFSTDGQGRTQFVRLVSYDGSDYSRGSLQLEGVRYDYYQNFYPDGTVLWFEGPAEGGQFSMPMPDGLIVTIPERNEISKISFENGTFSLELSKIFQPVLTEGSRTGLTGYKLSDVKAQFTVDQEGRLASCTWTYKESYSDYESTVNSTVKTVVEVVSREEQKPITWFRDSSTYVKPEYSDITETWREYYEHIPGKIIFDVRVPKIKENLPGASVMNIKIEAAFKNDLTATRETLAAAHYGDYVRYTTDYEVYNFGNNYEILISNAIGSVYGSGEDRNVTRFFYDAAGGTVMTPEEFLAKMGYDKEKFLAYVDSLTDLEAVVGQKITEAYTYEQLLDAFFVDADGNLQFNLNIGI